MCRQVLPIMGLIILSLICLSSPLSAQQPFLPPIETPIEQATAHVSGERLTMVRVLKEHVLETREEAYPVVVKVAETIVDAATEKPTTVYRDVTEMRTRTVSVSRPVFKQVMMTFDVSGVNAAELGGPKLDAAALKSRLAKQGLVLVKMHGPAVPEDFKLLFKPETIIVDLTQSPPSVPRPVLAAPGEIVPAPMPAVGQAGVEMPKAGDIPPQFRLASIDAAGNFVLKVAHVQDIPSTVFITKTEVREVEGKEVAVTVCEPIQVKERRESFHTTTYPANAVTGITVDEKPLDDRHREALNAREIPVIVSPDGKPVHSFWLQNLKPKMLVLTVPSATPMGAMAPAPSAPGSIFSAPVPPPPMRIPQPAPVVPTP